jgi:PadR family transcriptional regulator PadR
MSPRERGLLPGTVDLLILRTLVDGPKHGFGISGVLRDRSDGVVDVQDAALYQALHRIERQGWIKAEWGLSDKKRRAKFYQLTRQGHDRLEQETSAWQRYSSAVSKILEPGEAPAGEAPAGETTG